MNYLAHIYLARQSEQAMIGALLGDFVKGNAAGKFSAEVEAEIIMHRKIDTYTDGHRIVRESKALFDGERRRYAGILLDVFYDHVLAKNWSAYSAIPIQDFTQRFYGALIRHEDMLPANLAGVASRMIAHDWLASYRDYSSVEIAIRRISERLSRNGHLLREGLADLEANYDIISDGFMVFFPELIQFVDETRLDRHASTG